MGRTMPNMVATCMLGSTCVGTHAFLSNPTTIGVDRVGRVQNVEKGVIENVPQTNFRTGGAITRLGALAGTLAFASGLAVRHVHRRKCTGRTVRHFAQADTNFEEGQQVEVKISSGAWRPGIVASTSPLKVRPKGWSDSHQFDEVVAKIWDVSLPPQSKATSSHVAADYPSLTTAEPATESGAGPFDPSKQLGVTAPLGFFDPLGISKVGDEAGFRHLRSAELKHGRVAMLAATGCLVQSFIAMPGFEDVPRGLGAIGTFPANAGLVFVFLLSGAFETMWWKDDPDKQPGDFGNPWMPEGLEIGDEFRNQELNNGRFAMFAITGIICAELVSGKYAGQQLGF